MPSGQWTLYVDDRDSFSIEYPETWQIFDLGQYLPAGAYPRLLEVQEDKASMITMRIYFPETTTAADHAEKELTEAKGRVTLGDPTLWEIHLDGATGHVVDCVELFEIGYVKHRRMFVSRGTALFVLMVDMHLETWEQSQNNLSRIMYSFRLLE